MPEYSTKEKVEFKDIVIESLRKLSEKAFTEFKGGYWKKEVKGNFVEEVYVSDSRKEYIQGIEFLCDLLLPRFDEAMTKSYIKITEEINKLLKDYETGTIKQEDYVIMKIRLMRKLFQDLMMFTEDIKFFKKKMIAG